MLLGILAVIGFNGMKHLRLPENLGYEPATIVNVQIQKHVGVGGYELTATLADGSDVRLGSPHLRPDQAVGREICVRKSRDQIRGYTGYRIALPTKCTGMIQQSLFDFVQLLRVGPGLPI